MTISSACSGSLTALEAACNSIKVGSCDAAIVATASLLFSASSTEEFNTLGALTQDGKSKSFDAAG